MLGASQRCNNLVEVAVMAEALLVLLLYLVIVAGVCVLAYWRLNK